MKIEKIELIKSLNKTFRKEQVNRADFDNFKSELQKLLSKVDENESEEHLKYPLRDFLLNTSFSQNEINTKGRTDLAIYSGNTNKTPVNVIFETKKPNSNDFPTLQNINCKAIHEAVLYYIRERYEEKNDEIKHIIITNVYEWFIFDAHEFERAFFVETRHGVSLQKEYEKWKAGQKTSKNTDHFYKIVKQYIENTDKEITFTHFDIRDYEKILTSNEKAIVPLFKILSATHLLKLSYITDSNSLNFQFYNELLYIVGLTEVKDGTKKLIQQPIEKKRISGSLIENTISTIKTENRLSKTKELHKFGDTEEEQLLNIALELTITWINRILFLKLLEAQLVSFHRNDEKYKFLDVSIIQNFNELNELFFDILAKEIPDRENFIKNELKNIPYLNSSLFEISKLEDNSIRINSLKDRLTMPVYSHTVLTDKKKTNIPTLEYLFEFLNAYNFTNEGADEIQEENKSLINASVLGLIFEKINGYKEGSFFTPGYITMYMSRETIRRAVIQKFNEHFDKVPNVVKVESFEELKNKIENREEANRIINSIKIIDPAVGSGHFLVSALNEIIAIKSELDILSYKSGRRILDFKAEVVNDDLIITNVETEEIFEYTLNEKGNIIPYKQDLQEAIFNEKQIIIENCLFGVDINPNSVSICRLRLWIELLKHTYYIQPNPVGFKNQQDLMQLETLPNIDINIKQGNSLISNFGINGNGLANGQSQKIKLATKKYKDQVILYKSTDNKKVKKDAENKIAEIKGMFSNVVRPLDKDYKLLKEKEAKLGEIPMLFTHEDKENWEKQRAKLNDEIIELSKIIEYKNRTIYRNAFEWRFEFPEVLDENGNFEGFDVMMGNPPYGATLTPKEKEYHRNMFANFHVRWSDTFNYFIAKGLGLLRPEAFLSFIVPNNILFQNEYVKARKSILNDNTLLFASNLGDFIFKEAEVPTCLIGMRKKLNHEDYQFEYSDFRDWNKDPKNLFTGKNTINYQRNEIQQLDNYSIGVSKLLMKLMNRFGSDVIKINEITEEVANGIQPTGDKIFRISDVFATKKRLEKELLYNVLVGRDFDKYVIRQSGNKIIYTTKETDIKKYPKILRYLKTFKSKLSQKRETKKGTLQWWCLHWPRYPKLFEEPKIIIRQTSDRIIATFDTDGYYVLNNVIVLKLKKNSSFNEKFILGILNSKLMNFIYQGLTNEKGRVFAEVKPQNIRKLPIPMVLKSQQIKIAELVSEIMDTKHRNPTATTNKIEKQIDRIVYKLYKLTKQEIAEIEKFYE